MYLSEPYTDTKTLRSATLHHKTGFVIYYHKTKMVGFSYKGKLSIIDDVKDKTMLKNLKRIKDLYSNPNNITTYESLENIESAYTVVLLGLSNEKK